jgi:phage gp29-like protein
MENQINPAIPKDKPTTQGKGKELGQSGTLIFNGIITGEEYNANLLSKNKLRIYDQMRRSDSTVHSTLLVCKLPIMAAVWDIQSASDDESDQYVARFVKNELLEKNIVWTDFLRQALTNLDFGYSVAEKTYEMTNFEEQLRIGIQKIGFRKQTSVYAWTTVDQKLGITQQLISQQVSIPMEKLIVFTNDKEGDNYEGISVLRYCYKDWDMKDKLGLVNAIALEKMAVGIPVLKAPPDADQTQVNAAKESLRAMRANEEAFASVPVGWDVSMLDMKANSTKDVIPSIQYHDRQIVRSVLAQFLELGASEGSGSRALSEDHSRLFILSLEAVAKQLQAAIQDQLIKQLVDLNFSDLPNGYPELTFSKISDDNILTMAQSLNQLATAGLITPNAETENYIREVLNFPELPDDEEESDEVDNNEDGSETALEEEQEAKDNLPPDPKAQAALKRARRARAELIDIVKRY